MKNALLVAVGLVGLSACGVKVPPCDADSTKELIISVVRNGIVEMAHARVGKQGVTLADVSSMPFDIAMVTTSGRDSQTGKLTCKGNLVVKHAGFNEYAAALGGLSKGQQLALPIEFTSHITDDGKQQLIEVGGHQNLAGAVAEYYQDLATKKLASRKPESVGSEQTLVGTINVGTLDSTLDLGSDKSIGFLNDSDAGKVIVAACKSGQQCKVTGIVDANENFTAVSSATRVPAPQ